MAENYKSFDVERKTHKPKRQHRPSNPNLVFRKRQPRKPETSSNVVYVSTKTSSKGLLEACTKLINNNEQEIIIYCLGAAIQRGVLLALQLCERHISYQCCTKTFSTTLIDDLEPVADDADYEMQKRCNSALRIRVFRKDPLEQATTADTVESI